MLVLALYGNWFALLGKALELRVKSLRVKGLGEEFRVKGLECRM
jgi:hypothetical protein